MSIEITSTTEPTERQTAEQRIMSVTAHLWGIESDAEFWDGWRTYGDDWARRYLRRQIHRGVDIIGDVTRSQLLGALA